MTGEPIEHNLISRAIENAQTKVEGHNFDIRKHLIEYDDVMNQQREVIYGQRREILMGKDLRSVIMEMIRGAAEGVADTFADEKTHPEYWDLKAISDAVYKQFNFRPAGLTPAAVQEMNHDALADMIAAEAVRVYEGREALVGAENFRQLERIVMLQTVDNLWKDHLLSMDHLKEGIGLRGYAQQNPLLVYKKEGFEMFQNLMGARRGGDPGDPLPGADRRAGEAGDPPETAGAKTHVLRRRRAAAAGARQAQPRQSRDAIRPARAAAARNTKNAADADLARKRGGSLQELAAVIIMDCNRDGGDPSIAAAGGSRPQRGGSGCGPHGPDPGWTEETHERA